MASRCTMALVVAVAWAAGCATKPEVVAYTGPHPPTQPDQVKIYQKPPLKYERLGVVSIPVPDDAKWDAAGNADFAFDQLRAKAAERGANGLLLVVKDERQDGTVLVGYKYEYYQLPIKRSLPRAAFGEAIFVHQDY